MIDPNILRTNPDLVRESQEKRGEDSSLVDQWLAADVAARKAQQDFDSPGGDQC